MTRLPLRRVERALVPSLLARAAAAAGEPAATLDALRDAALGPFAGRPLTSRLQRDLDSVCDEVLAPLGPVPAPVLLAGIALCALALMEEGRADEASFGSAAAVARELAGRLDAAALDAARQTALVVDAQLRAHDLYRMTALHY